LKTTTKKDKEVSIKLALPPSKHSGFINFINMALNQNKPVIITFEKISKSGEKSESKIVGTFKFEGKDDPGLKQLEEEIQDKEKKRKKQHQKRVQK
jgi:negative regulator of genetic competence, sporulation and motility